MWKNSENSFCLNLKNQTLNLEKLEEIHEKVKQYKYYGDVAWPDQLPHENESLNLINNINKQLIKNNEEYCRFASDYIHCLMCDKVYDEKLLKGDYVLFGEEKWEIKEIFQLSESDDQQQASLCYSVLFLNAFKKQMVLSHRGLNVKLEDLFNQNGDLKLNVKEVLLKECIPQLAFCYHVTKIAYDLARNLECFLSFTGYANGAWLAEHSIYFCERELKTPDGSYQLNFQIDTKAVLFDSPGVFKNNDENALVDPEASIDYSTDLFIVNYLTIPNLANSLNEHSGFCYRLLNNNNQFENKKLKNILKLPFISLKSSHFFILNALNSIFDREKLQFIIENFFSKLPSDETVINCERVCKWPLINIEFEKDFEENFVEFFTLENFDWAWISEKYGFVNNLSKRSLDLVIFSIQQNLNQNLLPSIHILPNLIMKMQQSSVIDLKIFDTESNYKELKLSKQEKQIAETKLTTKNKPNKERENWSKLYGIYSQINGAIDDYNFKQKLMLIRRQKFDRNEERQLNKFFRSFSIFTTNSKNRPSLDFSYSNVIPFESNHSMNKSQELLKVANAFVVKIDKSYKTVTAFENFHIMDKTRYMDKTLSDLSKIIDCLKQKTLSNIVFTNLTQLAQLYRISKNTDGDNIIYLINNNNGFKTLSQIKELYIRLKHLYPDLDKYIDQSNENKSNQSLHFILSSHLNAREEHYVKKIGFDQIDAKLLKENEKRFVLFYGESGIGKMTLASEYSNYLFENHDFIIRKFYLNSLETIFTNYIQPFTEIFNLNNENNDTSDNVDFDYQFQRISEKLFGLQSKILFIISYDQLNNEELLSEKLSSLLKSLPENVYTLITSEIDLTKLNENFENSPKIDLNYIKRDEAENLTQKFLASYDYKNLQLSQLQLKTILNINEQYTPLQLRTIASIMILSKGLDLAKLKHLIQSKEYNHLYRDLIKHICENDTSLLFNLMFKISFLNPNDIEKTFLFRLTMKSDFEEFEKTIQLLKMLSILKESKENEKTTYYSMHKLLHENLKYHVHNNLKDELIEKICQQDMQSFSSLIDKKEGSHDLKYILDYLNEIVRLNLFNSDYHNVSEIYFKIGFSQIKSEYEKAIKCFERSLELFLKPNSSPTNCDDLSKLAFIHMNIGYCSYMRKEFDRAKENLTKSIELFCKSNNGSANYCVDQNFLNNFLSSISNETTILDGENYDGDYIEEYNCGKFFNIYREIFDHDSISNLFVQAKLKQLIADFLDDEYS